MIITVSAGKHTALSILSYVNRNEESVNVYTKAGNSICVTKGSDIQHIGVDGKEVLFEEFKQNFSGLLGLKPPSKLITNSISDEDIAVDIKDTHDWALAEEACAVYDYMLIPFIETVPTEAKKAQEVLKAIYDSLFTREAQTMSVVVDKSKFDAKEIPDANLLITIKDFSVSIVQQDGFNFPEAIVESYHLHHSLIGSFMIKVGVLDYFTKEELDELKIKYSQA